jgi:hypothetical protein
MIALGALKFFLLKVDPKKKMVFNPEESIDFHGFTGPFIQYTHARLRSILRKEAPAGTSAETSPLLTLEKQLLLLLEQYPEQVGRPRRNSILQPSPITSTALPRPTIHFIRCIRCSSRNGRKETAPPQALSAYCQCDQRRHAVAGNKGPGKNVVRCRFTITILDLERERR